MILTRLQGDYLNLFSLLRGHVRQASLGWNLEYELTLKVVLSNGFGYLGNLYTLFVLLYLINLKVAEMSNNLARS